jgi:hypothetical protein
MEPVITIVPHRGTKLIEFGMTRGEVERRVGEAPIRRVRRSEFDAAPVDFYRGFVVQYDAHERCMAIEFSREASVEFDGLLLFELPAVLVRDWARKQDAALESSDGFVSRALGLSMYAPFIDERDLEDDEKNEPALGFVIFKPGYYEEENLRLEAVTNELKRRDGLAGEGGRS